MRQNALAFCLRLKRQSSLNRLIKSSAKKAAFWFRNSPMPASRGCQKWLTIHRSGDFANETRYLSQEHILKMHVWRRRRRQALNSCSLPPGIECIRWSAARLYQSVPHNASSLQGWMESCTWSHTLTFWRHRQNYTSEYKRRSFEVRRQQKIPIK